MPEIPASPPARAGSRRTLLIVAAAFVVGLLLFLWLWAGHRDTDDFYRADAPVAGPEGQVFEPLPVPMPGEQAPAEATPEQDDRAPGMVGIDESRPAAPPSAPPAARPVPATPAAPAAMAQPDSDPVIVGKASAPYPTAALRDGDEGTVMLRVTVAPDGSPSGIAIAHGSGSRDLDRAAMSAVRQWRVRPAMRNGQPVTATVQIPVSYRLGER